VHLERQGHVFTDGKRPEQRAVLKQHPHVFENVGRFWRIRVFDFLPNSFTVPWSGSSSPTNVFKKCCLAAPRRSEYHPDFRSRYLCVNIIKHYALTIFYYEIFDLDDGNMGFIFCMAVFPL